MVLMKISMVQGINSNKIYSLGDIKSIFWFLGRYVLNKVFSFSIYL